MRRSRGFIVGTVCAVGLLLLVAASSASAGTVCAGRNGRVAVSASGGVSLVTPAGRLRSIGGGSIEDEQASFSCDGGEFVFESRSGEEDACGHLEVADARSGVARTYPAGRFSNSRTTAFPSGGLCPLFPGFLADGRILFSVEAGSRGTPGTYTVAVNGGRLSRIFNTPQEAATADGRWFVAPETPAQTSLELLGRRGRRVRRLTPDLPRPGEYLHPSISPDGRWIVYGRDLVTPELKHRYDLFEVRSDGTHRRQLTDDGISQAPSFSPDGRWVVFRVGADGSAKNLAKLPVRNPGAARRITRLNGVENLLDPTWLAR